MWLSRCVARCCILLEVSPICSLLDIVSDQNLNLGISMNLRTWLGRRWTHGTIVVLSLSPYVQVRAQQPDGGAIYKEQCAVCHENSAKTRAQSPAALRLMSPENILRALESGRMKDQGSLLSAEEKRAVAQYLAGKPFGQDAQPAAAVCPSAKTPFAPASTDWNGWGADLSKPRFQH